MCAQESTDAWFTEGAFLDCSDASYLEFEGNCNLPSLHL